MLVEFIAGATVIDEEAAELFDDWRGDARESIGVRAEDHVGAAIGPGPLPDMLRMLGLENLLDAGEKPDDEALQLLDERESARKSRDFATADARRDELEARGWIVRDTPDGPKLVRKL